ncbi:hypothetical protein KM043_005066 [Ampulex compressa]|nr:hypothetical protein KM043_005066 [Ampulex compressa]
MGGVGYGEACWGQGRRQRARTEILLHNAVLLSCLFVHGHTRSGSQREIRITPSVYDRDANERMVNVSMVLNVIS